jgi:site-specific DNA-cytosine methylase
MRKYRLLDLFCGAGGASMGYYRAGFEVEGVENPYPITRYNDPRYLDKPVHDAFEKARQAILDVIKEE